MLGLCFVLYEALDLFQGCYQHYHHSNNADNGLADIEKHNKSVLTRTNKIIKDIIAEEDELCLIDDTESAGGLSDPVNHGADVFRDELSTNSQTPVATLSIEVEAQTEAKASLLEYDEDVEAEDEDEEEEFEDQQRHYLAKQEAEEERRLVATIVPGETTVLGMLEDNQRHDDELLLASSGDRLELFVPSGDGDMEMKKRLLWKMELLNEKSSVLRQHNQQMRQHHQPTESTRTNNNNNNTQTIGDNESHFAKNYICNKQSKNFDYEQKKVKNPTSGGGAAPRFIDSAEDYEQNVNMIRVFSVSECVL